jgi:hypothetical protein
VRLSLVAVLRSPGVVFTDLQGAECGNRQAPELRHLPVNARPGTVQEGETSYSPTHPRAPVGRQMLGPTELGAVHQYVS